ncbi:bifunctional diaminohydroxyphosphoribosylaminopyrimidine deaminase/5-amino-6-(5-phosphoribosylamino)uracil reductase RibD [soil metagenome]
MVKIHEKYINRCIELAENGLGSTYPNPVVGSVLVYKDKIIGEGWHRRAGDAHAEVNAIKSVKEKHLIKKATIYVSLEPCSHFGKTPPCCDLIIASGIKKVVIGTIDPFAKVAGKGVKKLLDAGCEVIVGIEEAKCRDLNKRFFTFHQKKRPYIVLKWARSQDGFIAPLIRDLREPLWISNDLSRQLVHKWRSEEQAILIGTNTAVADNPRLNTRLWAGNNPVRVLLDSSLRVPHSSFINDGSIKTIIICDKGQSIQTGKSIDKPNIIYSEIDFNAEITSQIIEEFYKLEIQSVIIEGGTKTLQTFIDAGVWDEARVFTGDVFLKDGIKGPDFKGKVAEEMMLGNDNLKIYKND